MISRPFLLGATVKYHLSQAGTPLAEEIINNIYVDNIMITANETDEGFRIYKETKKFFMDGASMNLREYTTNDSDLVSQIPEIDRA